MIARRMPPTVTSSDGKAYHLPPGEHSFDGSATIGQVLDAAKTAAQATGKQFGVRVTEGQSTWWGMMKAAKPHQYGSVSY